MNQMSDADRAAEYAAMDSVLRRAEMGVPLVWSRAAHRLYPREFKRHARDVVLAACVPMTRHDVRGLAADKIVDQCLAARREQGLAGDDGTQPVAHRATREVRGGEQVGGIVPPRDRRAVKDE